jgi:hypothetical protein
LLAKRLRQLELAGVVVKADGEYQLTEAGQDQRSVVFGVGEWAARWQFGEPREDELDPDLLMYWVHDRLDFSLLPDRRIVLQFDFAAPARQFWIVKDAAGPGVCTFDPGFDIDVVVRAEVSTLLKVWIGRLDLPSAMRAGQVELSGRRDLVRVMPEVFLLSPIAPIVRSTPLTSTT